MALSWKDLDDLNIQSLDINEKIELLKSGNEYYLKRIIDFIANDVDAFVMRMKRPINKEYLKGLKLVKNFMVEAYEELKRTNDKSNILDLDERLIEYSKDLISLRQRIAYLVGTKLSAGYHLCKKEFSDEVIKGFSDGSDLVTGSINNYRYLENLDFKTIKKVLGIDLKSIDDANGFRPGYMRDLEPTDEELREIEKEGNLEYPF